MSTYTVSCYAGQQGNTLVGQHQVECLSLKDTRNFDMVDTLKKLQIERALKHNSTLGNSYGGCFRCNANGIIAHVPVSGSMFYIKCECVDTAKRYREEIKEEAKVSAKHKVDKAKGAWGTRSGYKED